MGSLTSPSASEPRTIVITGGSDGIGLQAARQLREQGHRVVIVGRNPQKTADNARDYDLEFLVADFSKLAEVRRLAQDLAKTCPRIDVLANNAGFIGQDRQLTEDGHEITFQVNYLAPFLLTYLLHDRLVTSRARVINTSSAANLMGKLDLANLENEHHYGPFRAYARSKLANVFFTQELARRWASDGVTSACFHPGIVKSSFGKGTNRLFTIGYSLPIVRTFIKTPAQGAELLVWLATAPQNDWTSGTYYDTHHGGRVNPQVKDAAISTGLWVTSLALLELSGN